MSREDNIGSLKSSLRAAVNYRLFGWAVAEVAAIVLAGFLLYAITLRLLLAKFNVSFEILMTYFAQDALPPSAEPIVLIMVGVAAVVLLLLGAFFEAGIFGLIARKQSFLEGAKKGFVAFVLLILLFEILDFVTGVFLLPAKVWPWFTYVGVFLAFLAQLFFIVWKFVAQFMATEKGAVSIKESFRAVTSRIGFWGRSLFVIVLFLALAVVVAVAFAGLTYLIHPLALVLGVLIAGAFFLYVSLVIRIFFWQRMQVK